MCEVNGKRINIIRMYMIWVVKMKNDKEGMRVLYL